MNHFKENNCRICKKVFCCKKCREKHETSYHRVFPNCDICIYGRTVLTHRSETLMKHLKSVHWPLRCILCKRYFGTIDELIKCNKCPIGNKLAEDLESSLYTPGHSYTEGVYESPPLLQLLPKTQSTKNINMLSNLATSTPLQRVDEDNILEQIQEAITPVESSEAGKENIASKKQTDPESSDGSLKRKVTFCETPMAESYRKQKNMAKKQGQDADGITNTPATAANGSEMFYTAKEDQKDTKEPEKNKNENIQIDQNIPVITVDIYEDSEVTDDKENVNVIEDNTLWISAADTADEKLELTPDNTGFNIQATTTPVVAKLKKRQVNVVIPTHITKRETSDEPKVQELSTPNTESTSCKTNLVKSNSTDQSDEDSNRDERETVSNISESPVQGRLWVSVSRLIKNVTGALQSITRIDENVIPVPCTSFKRSSPDMDPFDGPRIKRFKLTEIKCRRTIREIPAMELYSWEIHDNARYSRIHCRKPTRVDKATQTEDIYF